ncbi:hypothetical protein EJD97_016877 [Solanum chilense]|uniref:Uncharacterized protein n=1 Tax=Solanum chilense TaxID=4083 RepID=A0A6N2CE67_SOLCI|nr:hypothetical protein EJD97_016877 [Solanum chilense]
MYKNGVSVCYKINYFRLNAKKGSMCDLKDLTFSAFCYCYKSSISNNSFLWRPLNAFYLHKVFVIAILMLLLFFFIFILLKLNVVGCPIIWQFNYCH